MTPMYSVVYFKIPKEHLDIIKNDTINKYNDICKIKDGDIILNKLEEFYTNPHDLIERHRFIFVGNYKLLDNKKNIEDIDIIFKEISKNNSISESYETKLNSIFNNGSIVSNIRDIINLSSKYKNEILHFIPHSISSDDTIHSLYDIISLSIPNILTEQIFLFSNKSKLFPNTWYNDIKYDIIQALQLYIDTLHPNTLIPSINDVKYILWCHGVPYSILDEIDFNSIHINEPSDIMILFDNPLISNWIKSTLVFSNQGFKYSHYHNNIPYPILSCPFLYMDKDSLFYKENTKDTSKYFHVDYTSNKYIIDDVLIPDDNTFYMYSARDFENYILDDDYEHIYSKIFPKWSGTIISSNEYKINNETLDKAYNIYDKISSSLNIYSDSDLIKSSNFNPLYLELHYRLYDTKKTDILQIFNSIIPSFNIPFITMRDPLTKEYIYKLYRPITIKNDINDVEFPVSFSEIDRWINYSSYSVDNGKIKDTRDYIRGIQLKLLWNVTRLNDIKKQGKIYDIYDNNKYCSVIYNNKIYRDIPFDSKFISKKNDIIDNIKKDDDIFFFESKKTYIDISIEPNSHIYIKCPWKYLYDIPSENIDILFKNYLKEIFPIINQWNNNIELDLSHFHNYSRYLNGSSYIQEFDFKYTIELSSEYPIIYSDFINLIRPLQSIIVINEPVLRIDDIVEYYDIDKNKWISVKITNYNLSNDSFKIQVLNKTRTIDNVKRNFLRTMKDGRTLEKINEINFTYRKVSDFSIGNAIEQYILKLKQSSKSTLDIIEDINIKFNINDINKTTEIYNSYSEKIRLLNYLKFETGVDISIDYLNPSTSADKIKYNIYVKKIHSINELNKILHVINYIINIYIIKNYNIDNNDIYIQFINDIFDKVIITEPIITDKQDSVNISSILDNMYDKIDIDDLFNSDDIDDILQDSVEEVEENKSEDIVEEKTLDTKKTSDLEKQKAQKALAKSSSRGDPPLLKLLKSIDTNLFAWKIEGTDKRYARGCQKNKQVAVFTDDEKNIIDRDNPDVYTYDSNTICDMNNPEFIEYLKKCKKDPKKGDIKCPPNDKDIKCAALKWGSTPDNMNWYTCPRIYDVNLKKPLSINDLKKMKILKKEFTSKNTINEWRIDKDTNKDILEFINKELYDSNTLILRDDNNFYPGFMDPVVFNGQNIFSPCCYSSKSVGVYDVFTGSETADTNPNYVLQWGKELRPLRYGYLSDFLYNCFNSSPCTTKNKECFKRQSSIHGENSLLYAISLIVDMDYDKFIIRLISKLKLSLFNTLNRGLLKHKFKTTSNINPLQNYIEYLLSNEYKDIEYYYDLIIRPSFFNSCPDGFNLLIIEYSIDQYKKDDYNYNVIVPYYISNQNIDNIKQLPTAVLFKNKNANNYEILDYDGTKLFNPNKFKKIDELIYNVWNIILLNNNYDNDAPSNKNLIKSIKNNTVLFYEDAYNFISDNYKNYSCVYDEYQIVGIYINDNSLFIPIYPIEIPSSTEGINIMSFKNLIKDRNNLMNFTEYKKNLFSFMNKLNKTINFRYLYTDDNNNVIGILTSYSVYVPLKNMNIDNIDKESKNIPIKTNIFKIMENIDETHNLENKDYYVEPIDYNEIVEILNDYELIKKNNYYIGIYDKTNNLFIPIKNKNMIDISIKKGVREIKNNENIKIDDSMTSYLSRCTNFYNTNKNIQIPIRPIRLYFDMNSNKYKCKGFVLETGDIIEFNEKYHITINNTDTINKLRELVNNIVLNNLTNKLNKISLSRSVPLYIDKRILSNEFIEYHLNIYDDIIKILNEYLKNSDNVQYREAFINILTSNNYNRQTKMRLIKPLFITFIKLLFVSNNTNTNDCNNYKINLFLIDNIDKYIWSIYFMKFEDMDENVIKDLWTNTYGLDINDYSIENRYKIFKERWYDIYRLDINDDIEYEYVYDIYNKLYQQYNNKEFCMYVINNGIINVNDLIERLFQDLVKNKIIQSMILYEYTKIELTDRYIIHDDLDEIILKASDGEKMWNDLILLYEQRLHIYYNNLLNLNDIQYESAFTIELSESDKLFNKNIYNTRNLNNIDNIDNIEEEYNENLFNILDRYSNNNIINTDCEKYIEASFYRFLAREKIVDTRKIDKLKKINYKNYVRLMDELDDNRLIDIDINKLKLVLDDIVNTLFSNDTKIQCHKLNILFRLFDNSYIYNNNTREGEWHIIDVNKVDNIVSFKGDDNKYEYSDIEKFVSQ